MTDVERIDRLEKEVAELRSAIDLLQKQIVAVSQRSTTDVQTLSKRIAPLVRAATPLIRR